MSVRPRAARGGGRHFLRSSRLAAELVATAGVEAGDVVVDVGAGAGALTAALADVASVVHAVEVDPELAAELRTRFARRANVRIAERDARSFAWPREPFRVVANLPFAGAGAILRALLDDPRVPLASADVILQWESAVKRAAIWPSTAATVYWGAWHELRLVRRLPRCVFSPPPSVDAGVLRVCRRTQPLVPASEASSYRELLRRAFDSGRPVRGIVPRRTFASVAPELGLDRDARARDLDAAQWARMWQEARAAAQRSVRRGA